MDQVLSPTCSRLQVEGSLAKNLPHQSLKRNLLNQLRNRARNQARRVRQLRRRHLHRLRLRSRHPEHRPAGKVEKRNTERNSSFATLPRAMNESSATCLISRSAKTRRPSSSQPHRVRKKQTAFTQSPPTRTVHQQRCSAARENTSDSHGTKTTLSLLSRATKKTPNRSSQSFVFTIGTAKIPKRLRSFRSRRRVSAKRWSSVN